MSLKNAHTRFKEASCNLTALVKEMLDANGTFSLDEPGNLRRIHEAHSFYLLNKKIYLNAREYK